MKSFGNFSLSRVLTILVSIFGNLVGLSFVFN
jgi:hypothetical protein